MLSTYSNSIQANCDETIVNLEKGLELVEDTGVLVEHNAVSTMAIDEFRGGNGHGGTEEPSRQEAEGKPGLEMDNLGTDHVEDQDNLEIARSELPDIPEKVSSKISKVIIFYSIPLPAFSNQNIYNLPARTAVTRFLWPPWRHLVLFRAPSSCD